MGLRLEDLRFGFDRDLWRVDLDVARGDIACILGPSGVGKSTLLRCIAGLERPEGRVLLDGRPLTGPVHKRRIGFLFQEPALFPHLDVAGNVGFGLRYTAVPRSERPAQIAHWLDRVGLGDRGSSQVHQMSGGERQRVALARALAADPTCVLLDEPLSALDAGLRRRLGDDLRTVLHEADVPVVWVTHDEQEARRVGDACYVLDGSLRPLPDAS